MRKIFTWYPILSRPMIIIIIIIIIIFDIERKC